MGLREELAEAAAHILTTKGHENKTYTLTNNESIGFKAIADLLTEALGKQIGYTSPGIEEFKAAMKKTGTPEMYIDMFVMWGTAIAQETMDKENDTLSVLLNRKPTSMSQFIKSIMVKI